MYADLSVSVSVFSLSDIPLFVPDTIFFAFHAYPFLTSALLVRGQPAMEQAQMDGFQKVFGIRPRATKRSD